MHCRLVSSILILLLIALGNTGYSQNEPTGPEIQQRLRQISSPDLKIDSLNHFAWLFVSQDLNQSFLWASEALNLAREHHNEAGEAIANKVIGEVYKRKSDFVTAKRFYGEAHRLFLAVEDSAQLAYTANKLGAIDHNLNLSSSALEHFTEATLLYTMLGDTVGLAGGLNNIGGVHHVLGNNEVALDYFDQSLLLWKALDHTKGMAFNHHNIGNILTENRRYDEALDHYMLAIDLKESLDDELNLFSTVLNVGILYQDMNRHTQARSFLTRALNSAEKLNHLPGIARCKIQLGNQERVDKNYTRAFRLLREAIAIIHQIENRSDLSDGYAHLGNVFKETAQYDSAFFYLEKALAIGQELKMPVLVVNAYVSLAETKAEQGDFEGAYESRLRLEAVRDSAEDKAGRQKVDEFEARFRSEQRQKMLDFLLRQDRLNAEEMALREDRQAIVRQVSIVVIVVLAMAGIMVFWSYKRLKKANRLLSIQNHSIRRQNEDILRQKEEKEVLLKEIHHRVKNNLQVINSLLRLQSMQIEDEEVLDLFAECQNRVISMALIHEKMYETQDLAHIEISDYIHMLGDNLIKTYRLNRDIDFEIEADVSRIGIDTLVPLGLILNEIISNSLKYAFPERDSGSIFIRLKETSAGIFVLLAGDDGVGLPPEVNVDDAQTLGMELIRTLSDQLDGSVRHLDQPGTVFQIDFRSIEKKSSRSPSG